MISKLGKLASNVAKADYGGIGKSVLGGIGKASPTLLTGAAALGTASLIGAVSADTADEEGGAKGGLYTGAGIIGAGALVGAAIGVPSLAKGLVKGGALNMASGFAGKELTKMGMRKTAGKAVGEGFKAVGKSALGGASKTASGISKLGATLASGVVGSVGVGVSTAKSMITVPKKLTMSNVFDTRFNAKALPLLGLSVVVGGALGVGKSFEDNRKGVSDGMMRTATPMLPQLGQDQMNGRNDYANNAGATGDIVFAMRNNR